MGFLFRRTDRRHRYTLFAISCLLLLLFWLALTRTGRIAPYFLPSPGEVWVAAFKLFQTRSFYLDIWASVFRVSLGYLISIAVAIPIGTLVGSNSDVEAAVEPFVEFIRYMPVAGFVPLCILWLGIGDVQKIAVIFIGTFFQMVPLVADAVKTTPRQYTETARALGASDCQILFWVILPYSHPGILDASRIGCGIAWTYLIVAEIVAAASGIGHLIVESQRFVRTPQIFVGIITVGVLGLIADYGFRALYRRWFPWVPSLTRAG